MRDSSRDLDVDVLIAKYVGEVKDILRNVCVGDSENGCVKGPWFGAGICAWLAFLGMGIIKI